MEWRPKDLKVSLYPLTILFGIIAFGTFENLKRPYKLFTTIYTIIFLTLYYIMSGIITVHFFNDWLVVNSVGKVLIPGVIFHICNAEIGYILTWYHRKTRLRSMARIMKIDKTLEELGVSMNYTIVMIYSIATVIGFIVTLFVSYVLFDKWHLLSCISNLLNTIHGLDFCISVRIVEMRFRKANEVLERVFKPVCEQTVKKYPWQLLPNEAKGKSSFLISKYKRLQIIKNRTNTIRIIRHVYLELLDISSGFDRMFGIQVASLLIVNCVFFTAFLWIYATVERNSNGLRTAIGNTVRILKFLIPVMFVNHVAHTAKIEAKRTGDLIHSINDVFVDSELADEIKLFSLFHKHHYLSFKPAGLFVLGHGFISLFFKTALTYLIILIQSGPTPT